MASNHHADTIQPTQCRNLPMTFAPEGVPWAQRLASQLQSLSSLTESLTLRLLVLEERLDHCERAIAVFTQTTEEGGSSPALLASLKRTGQRISKLECLLKGSPARAMAAEDPDQECESADLKLLSNEPSVVPCLSMSRRGSGLDPVGLISIVRTKELGDGVDRQDELGECESREVVDTQTGADLCMPDEAPIVEPVEDHFPEEGEQPFMDELSA